MVQQKTGSGFPATWDSRMFNSNPKGDPIPLDEVVNKAKLLDLNGKTVIDLPQNATGVYSIYNETSELSEMKKIHLDQYSGEVLVSHTWADVGILMKARLWAMAFHQGEFGLWNWYLMIFVATGLFILSVSAIISYTYRKKLGSLSIPKVPDNISFGFPLVVLIIILGILLPLFGLSVVLLFLISKLKEKASMQN
jgi:uncharacterized iron-regulated membrane protein